MINNLFDLFIYCEFYLHGTGQRAKREVAEAALQNDFCIYFVEFFTISWELILFICKDMQIVSTHTRKHPRTHTHSLIGFYLCLN